MGPKNDKIRKKTKKNCYRSKFGHDRFRSGRGWIEAGKTHPGGPKEGHRGLKMAIYGQNYGQTLAKILAIILVTLTTLRTSTIE